MSSMFAFWNPIDNKSVDLFQKSMKFGSKYEMSLQEPLEIPLAKCRRFLSGLDALSYNDQW